jgi:hypothetical protein
MSLYYSPSEVSEARLKSVAREMAREIDTTIVHPGAGGFLWVGRDQRRFGPAYDPTTGVRVVCSGHLAWSAHEWARAERLPYEGGLGPRLLLERYLQRGTDAVAPYNGSTIVVVHDPRSGEHYVYTDQFGYHPCFIYRGDSAADAIVTTFPDALLGDPSASLTWDLTTMAEFVAGSRGTPPHTYFTEVKGVPAATRLALQTRPPRTETTTYWEPFKNGFFRTMDEGAEALAATLRSSIGERTAVAERPFIFVSGGADSRVLLFCANDPSRVVGFNIWEHDGLERDVSKQLCSAAGARFVDWQRDNDYYPRVMQDTVRWTGAMWSVVDAHFPGIEKHILPHNPDLVMTGCSTDWLFKGLGMEKEHIPLFGRSLPLLRFSNQRMDGFLGSSPPADPPDMFAEEIHARSNHWFAGCPRNFESSLDRLITVDRRVRPFSYNIYVSGQSMYRIYPYDTFMADSRIADCYSRIQPEWKLNRELWGRAASIVTKGAGEIVDANYGWRLDASTAEKLAVFARGWGGRRLAKAKSAGVNRDDRPAAAGSWPDYGWYARRSPTLRVMWDSISPEERERLELVQGWDPLSRPIEKWDYDGGFHIFRLLTLLCHWREGDRRRERAGLAKIATA